MTSINNGARSPPVVNVYHEKSMILPDVSRVLACLYEKDVKFETIKASYKDIFSLQASRSVPVPFYDGPVFLQDSRAICRYIAETYERQGYPFLLGKDVLERASIEQWLRHEEHAFDPPSRALFCHLAFPLHDEDDDDNKDIDREKRKLEEVLEVYEQRLSETEFLAGNKFTLADLVHLPGTYHVITSERFAYLYDSRKNVQRWWDRISARDSWKQVLKDMKTVEEQHIKEQLEQQQKQQWQTEQLPQFGRDIRIDPRQQEGTKPQTVLVAPPSTGTISNSIPSAPQRHETASDQKPSPPIQTKQGGFFTPATGNPPAPSRQTYSTPQKPPSSVDSTKSTFFTPAATPSSAKTHQRTYAEKSSYKDTSSPSKTSQKSPKEFPDKPQVSGFFSASNQNNGAGSFAKPSPKQAKIPGANQTTGAAAYDKPSAGSAKAPHKTDDPDSKADKDRATSPAQEVQSGPRNAQRQAKALPSDLKAPDKSPLQVESKEDIKGVSSDDERFKTERLRRMLAASEAAESQLQFADSQAPATPKKPSNAVSKKATEVDQNRATTSPAQNAKRQAKAPPSDQKVSDLSPLQVESKEDKKGNISDERFKTERLRRMFNESEAAALQLQPADSEAPTKEEAPAIPKKPSEVHEHDRENQTATAQDNAKTGGSLSTGTRALHAPSSADERTTISPPGGMAPDDRVTDGPKRSTYINEQETISPVPRESPTTSAWSAPTSSIQQAPPAVPSTDRLAGTAGIDMRAPRQTPSGAGNASALVQGADRGTHVTSDEHSEKSPTMGEKAPEVTPRKTPPSESRTTSAPIEEATRDARGKQAPGDRGEILDVTYSGDGRTTRRSVDKTEAEPTLGSQQTIQSIKGVGPTLRGISGDESAKAAMADPSAASPAPVQAPASGGQNASTVRGGGTLDANGKNKAVIPSTAPGRLAPTPDTQSRTTPGQILDQSPPVSSLSDTKNEKTGIDGTSQTTTVAPNEQPGGRVPRNAGASSPGPSPAKTLGDINEAYKEGASVQQLPKDQSRAQLAENKKKQGDDAAPVAKTGKAKENDFLAKVEDNSTGQAQATPTNAPSKLQTQSDQNRPQQSKDGAMGTNETANSPSLATSKEVLSPPEKSMGQQQLQGDRSGTSLQSNVKQGSEAALLESGTQQQRKKDLPTNADKNNGETPVESKSGEQTFSDNQQVKNSKTNSKSDRSKPTQFEGNEGNLPESERRGL
ncbi:uncharacterized protein LOC133899326 [Phragmites australis]|uniref:uncharacterized protein LOC133899326 n=1 Tax=Phragmites australis TaxID=29695 RepID=UPI002D799EC1|nr:uncharacterized protein LOC133899326 [Phragmites australis]